MSAVVLGLLVRGNLALSAAILVILLLRRPIQSRFGAVAGYALWLAAPISLLVALLPPTAPAGLMTSVDVTAAPGAKLVSLTGGFPWQPVLTTFWLAGVLLVAGLFTVSQLRFVRSLGPLAPWPQGRGVFIGYHRHAGPLVLGLFRPRIVLPADFEQRFGEEARALVLAHERVHLTRGDAAINGVTVALQCLAWFNPLVHMAAHRLRVDQEIACDAVVLSSRPHASRLYAETLMGVLTARVSVPLACQWPAGDVQTLKQRIAMMSSGSVSPRRRALGLGLVATLAIACAGAVWAANPAPQELIRRPNWVSTPTGADLARYYPAEAYKSRTGGMAVLECAVGFDGRLRACKVAKEAPVAAGFGDAALKLSERFQMSAEGLDGQSTANGPVRIPIIFALAPSL